MIRVIKIKSGNSMMHLKSIFNLKLSHWLGVILLCCLTMPYAHAKSLSVQVDRQQVEMGDIITLIIQTDFQTFQRPDLSALKNQFEVLGTQQSSQIQIVNGHYQSFSRWDVRLLPKQIGTLIVPPFDVEGAKSQPYEIKVEAAKQSASGRGSSFLESDISLSKAYVQQEVLFTLRFYHLGQFIGGNIRPPYFDQSLQQTLRNQYNYQKRIDGNLYEVYEWTWAFYPQKSGKMIIPPQAFSGRIQYNGRMKAVEDTTQSIALEVLPQPAQYPAKSVWLPAKELTLHQKLQAPKKLHVGDSITRTFTLTAKGLLASQLPEFEFENQTKFHIYPDKATPSNQASEFGVTGLKTQKIAIVPTHPGELTLPAYEMTWWNTETNQIETLKLPAKTYQVLPALQAETPDLSQGEPEKTLPSVTTNQLSFTPLWWLLTIGFAALWLVTLGFYLRLKTLRKVTPIAQKPLTDSSTESAPSTFSTLCQTHPIEVKTFYQAILDWKRENPSAFTTEIEAALNPLKSHLYRQTPINEVDLDTLCTLLKQAQALQKSSASVSKTTGHALEPIYPKST